MRQGGSEASGSAHRCSIGRLIPQGECGAVEVSLLWADSVLLGRAGSAERIRTEAATARVILVVGLQPSQTSPACPFSASARGGLSWTPPGRWEMEGNDGLCRAQQLRRLVEVLGVGRRWQR